MVSRRCLLKLLHCLAVSGLSNESIKHLVEIHSALENDLARKQGKHFLLIIKVSTYSALK